MEIRPKYLRNLAELVKGPRGHYIVQQPHQDPGLTVWSKGKAIRFQNLGLKWV